MIAAMKKSYGLSVRALVGELGISYATLMRWKRRLSRGLDPVGKPGPKKVRPLDLAELT
jgi:transposase